MLSGQKEYDIVEAHTIECKGSQQALAEFMFSSINQVVQFLRQQSSLITITLPSPCLNIGMRFLLCMQLMIFTRHNGTHLVQVSKPPVVLQYNSHKNNNIKHIRHKNKTINPSPFPLDASRMNLSCTVAQVRVRPYWCLCGGHSL